MERAAQCQSVMRPAVRGTSWASALVVTHPVRARPFGGWHRSGRAFGLASTVRGVGENPRDSGRGCRCRGSFQRSSGQWAPWDSRGGVTVMSMCSASSHTQSCMAGALDGPPPCPWLPRPRPSLRPRGGPLGSDENLHRCVVEGWRASGVAPCPKAPASALPQAALRIHRDFVSEDGSPVC